VSLSIAMDVRREVTRKLLDQPVSFFDGQKRGELVARALGDVDSYHTWLQLLLNAVVKGLVQLVASGVLLVAISGQLALVCLLGIPFLLPMRTLTRRTLKRAHRRAQETSKRVESLLQIFGGIRTVKAFGAEARRLEEFGRADAEVTRASLKVQRAKSTADALIEFINNFLALLLAVGGAWLILKGLLDVKASQLVVFLFLLANLYQPIKRLVKSLNNLQDSAANVERTQEYLALPPPPADPPGAVAFAGVTQSIRFENVTFAYVAGRPVLHDVSFEIPRGGVVALVGRTGSGKSTLCDLLLRFHEPTSGRITVDGRDVRDIRRASLLAGTAVVAQTPFLFHTSIRENIRQGLEGATDAQIEQAARDAQIHDHIASLPKGYDEEVGEAGVRLSGGQRQRITIARALVRNPAVLVLDEATSSLDTASEQAVQRALERLQEGRTTLVVAHRLSTVQKATRIVVLEAGRVAEQGTHDELLARNGLYADFVRLQHLGGPDAAPGPEPAAHPPA
jgi:ABC-type multidrug transport system fused ATPase/permease subunit